MAAEQLTKLDIAERQLNQAIRMFFRQDDAVSIHTLTAAASQVLYDLGCPHGQTGFLRTTEIIKDECRAEWIRILKASENFFKHADRDPDTVHTFNSNSTRVRLMEAIFIFSKLTGRMPWEHRVFFSWFCLKYPNALKDCDYKRALVRIPADPDDFAFFEQVVRVGKSLAKRFVDVVPALTPGQKPFPL